MKISIKILEVIKIIIVLGVIVYLIIAFKGFSDYDGWFWYIPTLISSCFLLGFFLVLVSDVFTEKWIFSIDEDLLGLGVLVIIPLIPFLWYPTPWIFATLLRIIPLAFLITGIYFTYYMLVGIGEDRPRYLWGRFGLATFFIIIFFIGNHWSSLPKIADTFYNKYSDNKVAEILKQHEEKWLTFETWKNNLTELFASAELTFSDFIQSYDYYLQDDSLSPLSPLSNDTRSIWLEGLRQQLNKYPSNPYTPEWIADWIDKECNQEKSFSEEIISRMDRKNYKSEIVNESFRYERDVMTRILEGGFVTLDEIAFIHKKSQHLRNHILYLCNERTSLTLPVPLN